MNPPVENLFKKLQSRDESAQNEAVAQLAMLFDKNGVRRQDDVWGVILTDDLMHLELSQLEIRELLDKSIAVVDSGILCQSSYLSLVGTVIKYAMVEDMEHVFTLFSKVLNCPNEDGLYGVLAEFTQFLIKVRDERRLQEMVAKFDTLKALEALQQRGSKSLGESALRTINFLKSPPKGGKT